MSKSKSTNEQKDTSGIRIFVYGTLKQGHSNHGLLKDADFLGRTIINGRYAMLDVTHYPGCVRTTGVDGYTNRDIVGEVYLVDEQTLYAVDILEGNGRYYTRDKVHTEFGKSWMYFLPYNYAKELKEIENGFWCPTDEELEWYEAKKKEAA